MQVVPAHTAIAYEGSRGIAPLVLNVDSSWRPVPTGQFALWEECLVPIE